MLIACPRPIFTIHIFKGLWPVYRYHRPLWVTLEARGRQLVDLRLVNHPVNPASSLLADIHASHEIGEAFVSGLISVDESIDLDDWFTRIGDYDTIVVYFDHRTCAAYS